MNGIQKAAILLMNLDPPSAAELLKFAPPETVTQIAAEVAYLKIAGLETDVRQPVKEFCDLLRKKNNDTSDQFVKEMLQEVFGRDKTKQMLGRVNDLVQGRDPFMPVRNLEPADIARAIEGESGQVAALVLGELPTKKSSQLLSLLPEEVRTQAVRGMTSTDEPSLQVKTRIATLILERLKAPPAAQTAKAHQGNQLKKVALLLRTMPADARQNLTKAISDFNAEIGIEVQNLMVTWEDIPSISDKSLQEIVRTMDAKNLALSLMNADKSTAKKIRSNISERANAMIDEETALIASPKREDIEKAREEILAGLRELNANGFLTFDEAADA